MRIFSHTLSVVPLLVFVGCLDEPSRPNLPDSRAMTDLRSQGTVPPVESGEALFAELSRRVPATSGFLFDRLGRIVVNVTSPADGPLATSVVREFLARGDIAVQNPAMVAVLWREVKYSFAQLATIRNALFDEVFLQRGEALSLDLDEARNRVTVGTATQDRTTIVDAVRSLLVRTQADSEMVEVIEKTSVRPSAGGIWSGLGFFTWNHLQFRGDPVVAGLSVGDDDIAPGWTCTVGMIADYQGARGLFTASHCTQDVGGDIWGVDGYLARQNEYETNAIGPETADPGPWGCGVWQLCRRSDAAFYTNTSGRVLERGLIARPDNIGSMTPNASTPYFVIVGESNGFVGQEIYKVGRTSGWRTGTITETCVDHNLVGLPGYVRKMRCGNVASNFNQGGDSGGPLFLPVGGSLVHFAGTTVGPQDGMTNTVYATISQIQLDYGNGIGLTRAASLAAPSVNGSIPASSPQISWSSTPGATSYQIYKQTDGVGPFALYTTTNSTSYTDGLVNAISVHNSPPSVPYVAYFVKATSQTDYSLNSNTIYFRKAAAITVTIQGQQAVQPNEGCYWTASASGGTGSYSYDWKINGAGTYPNSSQLFYTNTGASFTVSVTVADGASTPGNNQMFVSVSSGNPSCQL